MKYYERENIKRRYGISWQAYTELYGQQNGCCALCMKEGRLRPDRARGGKPRLVCRDCEIASKVFAACPGNFLSYIGVTSAEDLVYYTQFMSNVTQEKPASTSTFSLKKGVSSRA